MTMALQIIPYYPFHAGNTTVFKLKKKCKNFTQSYKISWMVKLYNSFFDLSNNLFTLAFTSFETNNKYKVQNSLGQQVYFAAEGNVENISDINTFLSALQCFGEFRKR